MFLLISGFFMDDKVTPWIEDYLEQKMRYLESKIFNLILEILLCFEKMILSCMYCQKRY